jgi:hypothetical protein
MSRYPDLLKPVRARIFIDQDRGEWRRAIVLQFNPETL